MDSFPTIIYCLHGQMLLALWGVSCLNLKQEELLIKLINHWFIEQLEECTRKCSTRRKRVMDRQSYGLGKCWGVITFAGKNKVIGCCRASRLDAVSGDVTHSLMCSDGSWVRRWLGNWSWQWVARLRSGDFSDQAKEWWLHSMALPGRAQSSGLPGKSDWDVSQVQQEICTSGEWIRDKGRWGGSLTLSKINFPQYLCEGNFLSTYVKVIFSCQRNPIVPSNRFTSERFRVSILVEIVASRSAHSKYWRPPLPSILTIIDHNICVLLCLVVKASNEL